jgi:PAS domain S-box-containing protein
VPTKPPARILIVEDDQHTAAYLELNLQQSGYRIAGIAHNGAEALRLLASTSPDIIIMDIVLPGEIDGIETANRIRQQRDLPILYLTAYADQSQFERAQITDPSAYLLKPFNSRELHLAIELAIQRHSRQVALQSRISSLMETMTDGFMALDRAWKFVFINNRAGEIFNRIPAMLIGKSIWDEFPEGIGQPSYQAYQGVMQERLPAQIEEYFAPWDRWFENRIYPTDDGICVYFHEITERKQAEQQIALANQRLQALSANLLTVQEEERRTLARELHDEIGQSLTALKITLQSLGLRPETAVVQKSIETAVSITDVALNQVRQMSLNLRPAQIDDLGLPAAIRWNVERQAGLAGIKAHFSVENVPQKLPELIAITCYRISQEAITNVLRHAHAATIRVRLLLEGSELRLEVQDDGAGFDQTRVLSDYGSMGILNMQERASLAGGHLEIVSAPGRGSLVRAIFPLVGMQ